MSTPDEYPWLTALAVHVALTNTPELSDSLRIAWHAALTKALRETGSDGRAAVALGVTVRTIQRWRRYLDNHCPDLAPLPQFLPGNPVLPEQKFARERAMRGK